MGKRQIHSKHLTQQKTNRNKLMNKHNNQLKLKTLHQTKTQMPQHNLLMVQQLQQRKRRQKEQENKIKQLQPKTLTLAETMQRVGQRVGRLLLEDGGIDARIG